MLTSSNRYRLSQVLILIALASLAAVLTSCGMPSPQQATNSQGQAAAPTSTPSAGSWVVGNAIPSWSPDGTQIAFVSARDGKLEIYVMESNYEINVTKSDGSLETRLTNTPEDNGGIPAWSPDGQRIAFQCLRDSDPEICTIGVDGSKLQNLTESPGLDFFLSPYSKWSSAWSPDGSKIVFVSGRDGQEEIYAMDAISGMNQIRLTNNVEGNGMPVWSPDGKQIAFVSARDGNNEIYVMDADGGNQKPLTQNAANDKFLAWSPDGKMIAFVSDRDNNNEIYVMDADGGNQQNITNNSASDDGQPAWSFDGKGIAFTSDRDGNKEVYVTFLDGSLHNYSNDPNADDYLPALAPCRLEFAFVKSPPGSTTRAEIWVAGNIPHEQDASCKP